LKNIMKNPFRPFWMLVALTAATSVVRADVITEATRTFTVNQDINDPQDPPQLFLETINDSAIVSLTKVEVQLHLVGTPVDNGFASDMYVALNQNLSITSILLNRVGISDSDPVGYYYDGWDVTLSDDAVGGDIHQVDTADGSGVLTGAYQPDGRVAPTDTSRPSLLSVFNGGSGNGDWRLEVGDLSSGGQMQLESWSLTLTGITAVPEPGTSAMIVAGLAGLALFARRKQLARKRQA
jgi:hypothetical protein